MVASQARRCTVRAARSPANSISPAGAPRRSRRVASVVVTWRWERWLLDKAATLTVQRFRTVCDHVRHAADRAAFLEDQVAGREQRTLTLTAFEGGCVEVAGLLDPEGGALLRTALDPLARPLGRDDLRSREHRYGDALVELCAQRLDTGQIPQTASQRSHLQVTTTLATLRDLRGAPAGEMEFAGLVAARTVQRLACDATITRVLVDAPSQVIDVGRSERVVPAALRRALNARDGGCRWPGCTRPPSWTSAHHVVHWGHLGPTDRDNLVLLCRHHHWCVHEGGWTPVHTHDDGILALSPVVGVMTPLRDPGPVLPGSSPPTASAPLLPGSLPPTESRPVLPGSPPTASAPLLPGRLPATTASAHAHRAREPALPPA